MFMKSCTNPGLRLWSFGILLLLVLLNAAASETLGPLSRAEAGAYLEGHLQNGQAAFVNVQYSGDAVKNVSIRIPGFIQNFEARATAIPNAACRDCYDVSFNSGRRLHATLQYKPKGASGWISFQEALDAFPASSRITLTRVFKYVRSQRTGSDERGRRWVKWMTLPQIPYDLNISDEFPEFDIDNPACGAQECYLNIRVLERAGNHLVLVDDGLSDAEKQGSDPATSLYVRYIQYIVVKGGLYRASYDDIVVESPACRERVADLVMKRLNRELDGSQRDELLRMIKDTSGMPWNSGKGSYFYDSAGLNIQTGGGGPDTRTVPVTIRAQELGECLLKNLD